MYDIDMSAAIVNTAANRTFDVTELRDAILQHLPVEDLLVIQRVCKSWQRSILTASSIDFRAKALFDITDPAIQATINHSPRLNTVVLRQGRKATHPPTAIKLGGGADILLDNTQYESICGEDSSISKFRFYLNTKTAHMELPRESQYDMYLVDSHSEFLLQVGDYTCDGDRARRMITAIAKNAKFGKLLKLAQKMYIWAEGKQPDGGDSNRPADYEKEWEDMCTKEEHELVRVCPWLDLSPWY